MRDDRKVLLVQPPTRAVTPRPPLGLMYISACLTRAGIDNDIIDIKARSAKEAAGVKGRILRAIGGANADIIGITCLVTEVEAVMELCRDIRKLKPAALIVLGGAQPTTHPEHFVEAANSIDYLVIGEGEVTFTELVKACRGSGHPGAARENMRKVDGLAWFEGDSIRMSGRRELIADLDSLPMPAYDKVDMDFYTMPTSWGMRPVLLSLFWIFSSRGCPFRCRYCVAHEIFGRRVRTRSPQNVLDEIEHLVGKYKIDGIYFYDESFTVDKQRVIDICSGIRRGKFRLAMGCQTRVDLVSDGLVRAMAEAGFMQIDFGVESGSDRLLRDISKDITVAQVRNAFAICARSRVRTFANMMVNLPGETSEDIEMSVALMKEIRPNVVIWNVTVPYPGSFLDRKLSRDDYKVLQTYPSEEAFALLDRRYRFAAHSESIMALMDRLYDIFPHPRYARLKLDAGYIRRWLRFADFLFDRRYIGILLRSGRKLQYLKRAFSQPLHN